MEFLQLPALSVFADEGGGGFQMFLPLIVMIFVLYYFVVIRGNRRERDRRDDMLNSLKKNDRVITIGGIIGTVASVSQDGREVTLKIDDNTRMKVLRSAIQGPLKEMDDTKHGDEGKTPSVEETANS